MNEPGDALDPPQRTTPLQPVTAPPSDSAEASMPAIEHYGSRGWYLALVPGVYAAGVLVLFGWLVRIVRLKPDLRMSRLPGKFTGLAVPLISDDTDGKKSRRHGGESP